MTGTHTKRIASGLPITETTSKRVSGAITETTSQRVASGLPITETSSERVATTGDVPGVVFNFWGFAWGDTDATKESGALTFGDSWGGSWETASSGAVSAAPSQNSTQRVASGLPITETTTKRVTETPQV